MSTRQTQYGIMLTKEQLDFLKDDNQGFHRMKALETFLSLASLSPCHYEKQGFSVDITVGQFVISIVELSALWHCDRKTAAKVVRLFNEVGMLSSEKNNRTSVHTILCLAAWYVDGVNEPVRNPHYKRPVRQSATNESQVSNVPSDGCLSFGGQDSSDTDVRKDGIATRATSDFPSIGAGSPSADHSLSSQPSGSARTADLGDAMNSASPAIIPDNRETNAAEDADNIKDATTDITHPDCPATSDTPDLPDGFAPDEEPPVYDDEGNVGGTVEPTPSQDETQPSADVRPLIGSSPANPNPAQKPQDDRL